MLEHITKCAKAPKYYETGDFGPGKNKYVDEDFRPEQFWKDQQKQPKAGRLSEIVRGTVRLFGESPKFSVSVENLAAANAVNKSVKGENQSSFVNAVKLLILQGWDTIIKGMFVMDHQSSGYDERINSGMHQIRLFINGE
jgi:hypothetical protein